MKKTKVSFSKPPKKIKSVIIPRTKPPSEKKAEKVRSVKERLRIERRRRHFEATKDFPLIP